MIQYFTAHTIICVCHSIRSMFRVLGMYNFEVNTLFGIDIFRQLQFLKHFIFQNGSHFLTKFTQVNARPKKKLLDRLLAKHIKEGPVKCATVFDKSWVILIRSHLK